MTLVLTTDSGPAQAILEVATPAQNTARQRALTLDSTLVANVSTVAGASVSDALNTLLNITVLPAGYVSRHAYVNAASAMIGQTFAGVTIEAVTTWTTPAQVPPGNSLVFQLIGAGGGGGGGHRDTSIALTSGGGGGGGAAPPPWTYTRAEILAMLPLALVAGLGGSGGLGLIMTGAVVTRAATSGGVGGDAVCGPMSACGGGGGPGFGTTPRGGGTGGGLDSPGTVAPGNTNSRVGGAPLTITTYGAVVANADAIVTDFGGAGHVDLSSNALFTVGASASIWGGACGAPGGGYTGGAATVGLGGGQSRYGGGGGGAGGGADAASGGGLGLFPSNAGGGRLTAARRGGGGAGGAGTTVVGATGSPGSPGANGTLLRGGDGGGGGGGSVGNNFVAGPGNTAGAGGAGGFPGGGGGGGGACREQASAGIVNTWGDGGRGHDAVIVVTGIL